MESVMVPCSNTKYGCTQKITYYQEEEHEKVCPNIPCFCPESSCGFGGSTAALLDHFTSQHKWPSTTIKYARDVKFCVQPGLHVLCSKDMQIFLLNMAIEPIGHAISVVCIQPKATNSKYKCGISYSCTRTGYFQTSIFKIRSSSLSHGLPNGYNLILPKDEISNDGKGVVLTISIRDDRAEARQPICLKPVGVV
jgi:E3 ubiquitin-protein ligase SIAH1